MDALLTSPLERLLISGGDSRLLLDGSSGLNRYGCGPLPREAVPFGSCTSSSTSPRAFEAARRTYDMLLGSLDPCAAAYDVSNSIRDRLRELLTLGNDCDIALAPSGTDVELLAAALAAGGSQRRVVNIVVGPSEVGSGTSLAAAACHYDNLVPSGERLVAGEPVDESLASHVDVETVEVRLTHGQMRSESQIDDVVTSLVKQASAEGAVTLLHVVAHSKTGMHAPSLACVERLRDSCKDVVVVIDAAQGRFSRRGLREALQRGYLVMFTGSKFYGGPPFSGALLVPNEFHPKRRNLDKLPAGFRSYFTAAEMPESWQAIRKSLPSQPNFGLILRWSAALAEIDAYYAVPNDVRLRVLRMFESEVPRILGKSQAMRLLPVFPPLYHETSERLLESKTTVFGFWVTPPGREEPLGKADLTRLHTELNTDVSAIHPNSDKELLSRTYHVGQPVHLGQGGYVLRLALGGELIIRVASDQSIGQSFEQRLRWLRSQIRGVCKKIDYLAAACAPASRVISTWDATGTDVLGSSPTSAEPFSAP